jgi:hypothetical protein
VYHKSTGLSAVIYLNMNMLVKQKTITGFGIVCLTLLCQAVVEAANIKCWKN